MNYIYQMDQNIRIASSVRLILAMFRLYAGIEESFGHAILNILKKQYPDQDITETASSIGHKMMAVAKRQLQNNPHDAMDAIQHLLTYITVGSKFEVDESGERVERKTAKPWDFRKDAPTWQEALRNIFSNLRTTAMSGSFKKTERVKREKTIDKAFGKRGDGGGEPEGGEGRMPTPGDTPLGRALDDKAATKEFIDLIDEHIPDLRASLSENTRKLFDLIWDDEVGIFGPDIQANMGQASALKEKHPDLYEKNAKRWSGFVGDTRKKLLDEIWSYIENEMSAKDYARIREEFFKDVSPQAVRGLEKKKVQERVDYQRGLDLRKVLRLRKKKQDGSASAKDSLDLSKLEDRLKKEMKTEGKDLEVELVKESGGKTVIDEESVSQVAARVAARFAQVNA